MNLDIIKTAVKLTITIVFFTAVFIIIEKRKTVGPLI